MREKIIEQIMASASMKEAMVDSCMDDIISAATVMIECIQNGGKVLWCGTVSYTHLTLPTNREV